MLGTCICAGNAITARISLLLKQDKLLLQVQVLDLSNNQLDGSLPESWGNLTNVRHCLDALIQLNSFVPQKLHQKGLLPTTSKITELKHSTGLE